MNNEYDIFQSFGDGDPSATFLSRCINAAILENFNIRFNRVNGGYTAFGRYYSDPDMTRLRIQSIDNPRKRQTIIFTYLMCGEVKGYVIDYTPLE